ncbi:Accessory gene regulator B [Syntrophobotulus glycolicus DSM 8271]|uniref:Accessory gene regulator B n=1 Tax=Syntrophobotulus glycolicus (strain DSM 8271 / FlGlyR) TaxID=645991 RepID=F0T1T8_SYNGF|nr:accessory gene regulator B family protein [Syntrophobotulus glycolicus]ADY55202.1 Accessory gene regulator B [Syntrophobotulus glycolicus DSM 8271]
MNLSQMAGGAANYLSKELALDTGKIDTLRFGLEMILATLIKGGILITLAYFLGILPEVMFAMACGAIYRLFSGGAHCSGYWRCLTLGLISYLTAGETGLYLGSRLSADFLSYSLLAGYFLSVLCVIAWVPGEVPFKKITSASERILFKILSLAYLCLWLGISVIMVHFGHASFAAAGLFAVMIQTISFSPPGYKVIHKADDFLIRLSRERRCSAHAAKD